MGDQTKKMEFQVAAGPEGGGEALCKYLVRVCRRDSIKTLTLGWEGVS